MGKPIVDLDPNDIYGCYHRGEKTWEELSEKILEKRKLVSDSEMTACEIIYSLMEPHEHPANRLDLQRMHVGRAIAKLKGRIKFGQEQKFEKLFVITGRMRRSNPILKKAVNQFAEQQFLYHYISKINPECVVICLQPLTWKVKTVWFIIFNATFLAAGKIICELSNMVMYSVERLKGL